MQAMFVDTYGLGVFLTGFRIDDEISKIFAVIAVVPKPNIRILIRRVELGGFLILLKKFFFWGYIFQSTNQRSESYHTIPDGYNVMQVITFVDTPNIKHSLHYANTNPCITGLISIYDTPNSKEKLRANNIAGKTQTLVHIRLEPYISNYNGFLHTETTSSSCFRSIEVQNAKKAFLTSQTLHHLQ